MNIQLNCLSANIHDIDLCIIYIKDHPITDEEMADFDFRELNKMANSGNNGSNYHWAKLFMANFKKLIKQRRSANK